MPTVDGSAISNGAVLVRQLNQAADVFMANGYIDKEIADSMRRLTEQVVTVNRDIYHQDMEDAYYAVSEEAGDAIRNWVDQDLTIANIKEKTQELVEKLKSIEGLDDAQQNMLNTIIGDIKSQSNSTLAQNLPILNDANALLKKLDTAKTNPLYDTLSKIGINVIGKKTNVFDLLQDLERQFNEVHISDFALDNKLQQEQIKDARKIISAARSIIYASQYDNLDASCLLYTSPSPRDRQKSRMPSSA